MSEPLVPNYYHRQYGPWGLLLYAVGVTFVAVAWLLQADDVASVAAVGAVMLVVGTAFHHLTVSDAGDHLAVRFGPLPLFRKRIPYDQIDSAEVGRTLLLDGWGIHLSVRGGWVWNVWGRACVVIRHGATTRVGTDDAENLARFLNARAAVSPSAPRG